MKSLAGTIEECEELLSAARAVSVLVECLALDAIDGGTRPDPRLILNAIAAVRHLSDEAHCRAEEALDRLTHGR